VSATVLTQNSNCFSVWATSLNDPSSPPMLLEQRGFQKVQVGDIFPLTGHFRKGMALLNFLTSLLNNSSLNLFENHKK
jgi:hypothetical protein